jgi:transcriptional regulator with XRE-family HTH domain
MRRGRDKLAARRRALGYSQELLAERLGVAVSTVARWEQGIGCPLPALRRPLADALSVSLEGLDHLLSGEDASDEEGTTTFGRRVKPGAVVIEEHPAGASEPIPETDVGTWPPTKDEDENVNRRRFLATAGLTLASGLAPSVPAGPGHGTTMIGAAQWLAWHLWQHRSSDLHQSEVPAAVAGGLAIHPHVSLDSEGRYRFTDPALVDVLVANRVSGDIAGGSGHLLATAQTTHATDLALGAMAANDNGARRALAVWSRQGATAVLRVNAAGVLAKIGAPDLGDAAITAIRLDPDARHLYLTAVASRVLGTSWEQADQFVAGVDRPEVLGTPRAEGDDAWTTERLAAELGNRRDHAARWCSTVLLAQTCGQAPDLVRNALGRALREEPCRENLRAYAAVLAGANPIDP